MMKKVVTLFYLTCLLSPFLYSQYILNGSAVQNSCNCYTLTPALNFQGGSVWQSNKINLNNSFDFRFKVFLGCTDANGADGIVFMLQPISTNLGISGGGMGFGGVTPSIGIALDTWQNTENNDPVFDHISIQKNGIVSHGADLAGPIQASTINSNIEDCQWHEIRITWDATSHWITTYFDDSLRLTAQVNMVAAIFNNDPWVFWGFSAATGGANNLQQFCTALNSNFTTGFSNNTTCLGSSIIFTDSSTSFTTIQSFYWDFGDGTTSTLQNPPPHFYSNPGNYIVKHAITGIDGCVSDTMFKTVTIGAIPVADFLVFDTCAGKPARIMEQSTSSLGNITQWIWLLDGVSFSTVQQPILPILTVGNHQLKLVVTSIYGCISDTSIKNFQVKPIPIINIVTNSTGCSNQIQSFNGQQTDILTTIQQWYWNFGDAGTSSVQNPTHTYATNGNYTVQLFAIASNGCSSDTMQQSIAINATPVSVFYVNDVCEGAQPIIVNNSTITAGTITQWSWLQNGQPFSTNQLPILTALSVGTYQLQLITTGNTGCISDTATDTFIIKSKPRISRNFVSNACTEQELPFAAAQLDVVTTILQWNWNFGNNQSSTLQNLNHIYSNAGNYQVQLWAVADNGCSSDTIRQSITISKADVFAGNDTLIYANSPFQLNGTGGGIYNWSPVTGLNNPFIANPITILQNDIVYELTINVNGCIDTDSINITVFKGSAIYVPTGFTPNSDNLNDILKPRYVGIKRLDFFKIYNRGGQIIFSTKNMSEGWNGTIRGIQQPTGTFVWMLKAEDFTGKFYEMKGITNIIR